MKKSTVRTIYNLDVYSGMDEILITIKADDFWPKMARIIVGTLIEVGRGNIDSCDISGIIESGDRQKAGPDAEAKGLFLSEIELKKRQ